MIGFRIRRKRMNNEPDPYLKNRFEELYFTLCIK